MKNGSLLILLLAMSSISCDLGQGLSPASKPDLIITQVTYVTRPFEVFEFTIHIKNIGTAELNRSFWISNSRSQSDFDDHYCSHGQIVNYPPSVILPAQSMDVEILDLIDLTATEILFVINTNDRYDRGVPLPIIDESSYDNNEYILHIQPR
jgi:hypothetical protein